MAKENGQPTAEEKGKSKMIDHAATNGEKEAEGDNSVKPSKDLANPKESKEGMSRNSAEGRSCIFELLLT